MAKALATLPANRWTTAREFGEVLLEARHGRGSVPEPGIESSLPSAPGWRVPGRWTVPVGVLLVVVAGVLGRLLGARTAIGPEANGSA